MDFLDPKKKRAHKIKLLVGYVLVATAIAIGSFVLLYNTYGYDIDRKTGKIIQNGLLFVDSHPVSSDIYLNGELNKSRTDAKLSLPAGLYNLELQSNGYRTWKRNISLEGGEVERIIYPFLFPENLVVSDVQLYAAEPSFASASPDRKWLVVNRPGSANEFDSYDIVDYKKSPTSIVLPAATYTAATGVHKYNIVEWSTDNRHLLVKHTFKGGDEFIVIDREDPSKTYNVNKTIGNNPSSVSLRDKNFEKLYVYYQNTKLLSTYNLKTRTLDTVLNGVLSYKSYGDDILLYAIPDKIEKNMTTVKLREGSDEFTIKSSKVSSNYLLDIAKFENNWYVVVSPIGEGRTYIYKNPQERLKAEPNTVLVPTTILKVDNPKFLSFSEIARFVSVQDGPKFAVYDIETDRRYYYELKQKIAPTQQADWMDGHRMVLVNDFKVMVFDYDGINIQNLSASGGIIPAFNRDYTGLYSIAPSVLVKGKSALTRTEPIVK